ncbi:helix-turn-helix domain-containing protein [Gilvimarinus xylanilyticus]|uniref:Helix-turn-helix domain-containing protein n=1 Tax=Gilvimarinus xylanilyticus TaxID=2944139 RepID=A0A9X2I822_9GAMM|nr:helix-turn-helix transcriptional regulator [Gilvimarinus xylanilyticus]MCP8900497.1 helix-turn-helix domain-containing protein [Gilvimarinus xylanilyticus]
MELGEKIKKLRIEQGWTQPQLAATLGIEQSTLSKIESGKLILSAETFDTLLSTFTLSIDQLLDGVSREHIRSTLAPRLSQVAEWVSSQNSDYFKTQRVWLFVCAALIVIGASGVIGGQMGWLVEEKHMAYTYRSYGVVKPGEPIDVYYVNVMSKSGLDFNEEVDRYTRRLDEDFLQTSENKGRVFFPSVEGGKRRYQLVGSTIVKNTGYKMLMMTALLLLVAGVVGVIYQWRLIGIKRSLLQSD